jgi:peptidoglycan/LPS O-acetylase OafA/YrhL
VHDTHPGAFSGFLVGVVVLASALAIAYTALKLYDEPVRKWLQKKTTARSMTEAKPIL